MNGWRARIGNLHPAPKVSIQVGGALVREYKMAAPQGVEFINVGLAKAPGLTGEVVEAMLAQIERAAKEISTQLGIPGSQAGGVDAIILGGTPLGFMRGYGSDKETIKTIEDIAGVPATTQISAVVEALQRLQVQKLAVYSPYYPAELNESLGEFLVDSGFDVVAITTGVDRPEIVANAPYGVYKPAKEFFMKSTLADGFLLAGGGSRSFEILEALEHDIGRPVTSSNQAALWKALDMVNVRDQIHGYGQLLTMF